MSRSKVRSDANDPPPDRPVPAVRIRVVGTAPKLVNAPEAVVEPVPPWATEIGKVTFELTALTTSVPSQ